MTNKPYTLQTRVIKDASPIDPHTGAVNVPLHYSSTYHQFDFDQYGKYDYSRSGNPTREALEEAIARLEGGVKGFAFSSGMAAISTAFLLLSQGDHVLISEDVYGGTYRMITQVLNRFGIQHTFVDTTDLEKVACAIRPNTKVIYLETPSNPTLNITDIQGVVKLAKANGCLTFLDNTFMTPALQRPIELGVDLVLHSATKFLAGHSDVVAGLAVAGNDGLAEQIAFFQNAFGAILGVQDAWLVLRGLKTLHVRMKESSCSAQKVASFLQEQEGVSAVYYPGLSSHPGAAVHKAQSDSPGAVLSFELKNRDDARQFLKHIKIPVFAVSLGAVESILSYPAKMSHAAMPEEERNKRGITDGLLRFSVGLENADDLIQDIRSSLSAIDRKEKVR
ncbi:cystathionine beta-lyase [Scopulibacillus darangshiensis]|uniref:cysteine-S-conjugate beta-lyase n=1 Tax=Scopulibacillus darangshiensis TaxID=442528 RepID=A0A4R2NGF5_9BACL|nr:cystathionine beta-lyase [Scopulibacillus darangshiensis]TCP20288.1 cystathionine beta-lyase [Scopulibacillus darangshiensis]